MKIYVITAGSYSDYHVCGVATTPEMAEKLRNYYSNSVWDSNANIEIYDSDQYEQAVDFAARGYHLYKVSKYLNDNEITTFERDHYDESIEINNVKYCRAASIYNQERYEVWVYAKTEEYAKKIGCDLIAQYQYEHMDDEVSNG